MPRRSTDHDIDRDLDRSFEKEPTFGTRRRIPLNERGAVRVFFFEQKKPTEVKP